MQVALGTRSGVPPPLQPPAESDPPEEDKYSCDCPGFKTLNLMEFCLRCLTAYSEGLEHAPISRLKLEHEMRRVAVRLAVLLKDEPILANLPLSAVLRGAQ